LGYTSIFARIEPVHDNPERSWPFRVFFAIFPPGFLHALSEIPSGNPVPLMPDRDTEAPDILSSLVMILFHLHCLATTDG
jgi:hypothetical protein